MAKPHDRVVKVLKIMNDNTYKNGHFKEKYHDELDFPHGGGSKPEISITAGKAIFKWNPDGVTRLKNNKNYNAYEVWDGQSDEACLADVFLYLLAIKHRKIEWFCVVCIDEEGKDYNYLRAKELRKWIYSDIINKKPLSCKPNICIERVTNKEIAEYKDDIELAKYLTNKWKWADVKIGKWHSKKLDV